MAVFTKYINSKWSKKYGLTQTPNSGIIEIDLDTRLNFFFLMQSETRGMSN